MRTALNVFDVSGFSDDERLRAVGSPARSTYERWVVEARRGGAHMLLPTPTLLRLSALLGTYAAARIRFREHREAIAWLRSPAADAPYGGRMPLDLLLGMLDEMLVVRRELEAWCEGPCRPPIPGFDDGPPYSDEDVIFS